MEASNASQQQQQASPKPLVPPSSLSLPMGSNVTTPTTPSNISILTDMNQQVAAAAAAAGRGQHPGGLQRMNSAPGQIGMMGDATMAAPGTPGGQVRRKIPQVQVGAAYTVCQ